MISKYHLKKHFKPAWIPITVEKKGDILCSKFAGTPFLSKNEHWPLCGNCQKPMQLFLQLNSDSLPSGLHPDKVFGKGILQIFYCTSEDCETKCQSFKPYSKATLVRIVNPYQVESLVELADLGNLFEKVITGWTKTLELPHTSDILNFIDLDKVNVNENLPDIIEELKEYNTTDDKLLGYPNWVQYPEDQDCDLCGQSMTFIFQFSSNDNIDFTFGDMGGAYLYQCPTHRDQLSFFWQCT